MTDKKLEQGDLKKTLSDSEIVGDDRIGRRSTLRTIGIGVVGAAVGAVVGLKPGSAKAQGQTDSDTGPHHDAPGHGTGTTDSDAGNCADGAGHGRGRRGSWTDSDGGACADGGGHGRVRRPAH